MRIDATTRRKEPQHVLQEVFLRFADRQMQTVGHTVQHKRNSVLRIPSPHKLRLRLRPRLIRTPRLAHRHIRILNLLLREVR